MYTAQQNLPAHTDNVQSLSVLSVGKIQNLIPYFLCVQKYENESFVPIPLQWPVRGEGYSPPPGLMTNFNKRLLFCYITIKHLMLMP